MVAGWTMAGALVLGMAVTAAGAAPAPDPLAEPKRRELRGKLEAALAGLASDLEGSSGYLVRDLTTGETFERNADAVFPAASVIKLPVLLELLRQAEEGTVDLSRPVAVDPQARVEGGGVLEKWSEPYPALTAGHLAVLMMDFSDNYATNLLIDVVGMERVGRRLKGWGLRDTLLRREMMDVEAARAGRENVSTPRDLVTLLERLHRGQLLDPEHTRRAIAIMKRNEDTPPRRTPIKRGLPPDVEAADKEGELDGVRCGAGIVFVRGAPPGAGDRPFALAVMTAYLKDDAAGEAYISAVTRAAYDYFRTVALSSEHGRRLGS